MFGPYLYQYVVCSGSFALPGGDVTGCLMRRVSGRIIALLCLLRNYRALYGVVSISSYQLPLGYCLLVDAVSRGRARGRA
jgi:hypothetical protein